MLFYVNLLEEGVKMALPLAIMTFVTTVALIWGAYKVWSAPRNRVESRLEQVRQISKLRSYGGEAEEGSSVLTERFLKAPLYRFLDRILPDFYRKRLSGKILYAGNNWKFNLHATAALQLFLAIIFAAVSWYLFRLLGAEGGQQWWAPLFLAVVGAYLPWMMLNARATERQKNIREGLPEVLDMLLVSVEAGMGFDMALRRMVDRVPGEIGGEFTRALEEMRMGRAREEALRNLAERTGVEEVRSFTNAVIQSEHLGSNIARTLRSQSDTMRQKRRQRVQEKAMKAPVTMLFPLVFFIFPTLFVVIMGPAVIQIIEVLLDF